MAWFGALALLVGAVNPPRYHGTAPASTPRVGLVAALVAGAAVALVAALTGQVIGALDVSAPNWQMAAGIVVVVGGVRDLARGRARDVEDPVGAVVPVAFPVLLRPEVVFATTAAALAFSPIGAALVAVGAVALGAVTATRPVPASATVLSGLARSLGAVTVVLGVDVIVDGVLSV